MSLYTRIVSGLLFPLHERLKQHDSVARRRALEDSQWWSREQLLAARDARLAQFIQRIASTVPWWRDWFAQSGLDPQSFRSVADLSRLPIMDKAFIRAAGERLFAEPRRPMQKFSTGGSSGEPLTFYLRARIGHDVAAKWRATRWWNVDIGDPELVLWGSPIELSKQDRIKAIRDHLLRTQLVPAFDLSDTAMREFFALKKAQRPRMLFGYPSAFARLAAFAEQQGIDARDPLLRVVFVTAERLYPHQRELISRVFGVPVANGYGARDAGFLAHECPHGGLHIMAEDVILETLDADGQPVAPGESGEIVVTHLATGDFPFVRYRTGDRGRLDDRLCPCGRGLPLLADVDGRTTDFVVAADGTVMHGLALIYVVRELASVERFQIRQKSPLLTEVAVIAPAAEQAAIRAHIEQGMRARLGADVSVVVNFVEAIANERNGKFRYVISECTS